MEGSSNHYPTSQSYSGVVADGNSQFHAGNVHNNYYNCHHEPRPTETTSEDKKAQRMERLLEALAFDSMDYRSNNIATEQSGTCQWLYSCPEYLKWQEPGLKIEHHGCLWIKGKPGAGKSTIMKSLARHIKERRQEAEIITCFFNARGQSLERATEGIYRSMLYQMAERVPLLWEKVDDRKIRRYGKSGWPIEVLKDLCREAVKVLASKGEIICFVDALDEGDSEDDVRDMVAFLEELTEMTFTNSWEMSVCLASRHYPLISMNHCVELVLDAQKGHSADIKKYVSGRLRLKHQQLKERITGIITCKASSVFLWVLLVVHILNKEADHGNSHLLLATLEKIPTKLNELFHQLAEKWNDDERFLPAILWVLLAQDSLVGADLYYALRISVRQLSTVDLKWDESIGRDVITDYILSSSKGFLEVTGPVYNRRVQFIHESAREFFMTQGLRVIDESFSKDVEAIGHGRLAQWCQNYLELASQIGILNKDPNWLSEIYPFMVYARKFGLQHANIAAEKALPYTTYANISFDIWNEVFKDTSPRGRPCSTMLHVFRNTSPSGIQCSTMLHIFMRQDLRSLVKVELEKIASCDSEERRSYFATHWNVAPYECPALCEAIRTHNIDIAHALLANGFDPNIDCNFHGFPLKTAVESMSLTAVECLLDGLADVNILESRNRNTMILGAPIRRRNTKLLKLLLERGASIRFESDGHFDRILIYAIKHGNAESVETILKYGEYPNSGRGSSVNSHMCFNRERYTTALITAVGECNPTALDCPNGESIQFKERRDEEHAKVRLLLEHGANVNAWDAKRNTALDIAILNRDLRIIQLLQDCGANINEANAFSINLLRYAAQSHVRKPTALMLAVQRWDLDEVRSLLVLGADVHVRGVNGRSVLDMAILNRDTRMVELLQNFIRDSDKNTRHES